MYVIMQAPQLMWFSPLKQTDENYNQNVKM